jgi:hypothetical protein
MTMFLVALDSADFGHTAEPLRPLHGTYGTVQHFQVCQQPVPTAALRVIRLKFAAAVQVLLPSPALRAAGASRRARYQRDHQ